MPATPTTILNFKPVKSVPNLMMSEDLTTDEGDKLLAFTTSPNLIHVIPADGKIAGFAGFTVTGTNVTAVPLDWKGTLAKVMKNVFGLGDGGGEKLNCETHVIVHVGTGSGSGTGAVVSVDAQSSCTAD
ncbi:MAG: hypothetical protein ACRDP7_42205 [Trebonia sp.]